ncbi:ABC transporter substrate-binding protein [Secundilactobacillus silagei]|uniref:ABC transporter substrate-binding protein n=1 Tax=Secundilactobacillus silagei TaxID=1293415 RepID=UPI000ABFC9E4
MTDGTQYRQLKNSPEMHIRDSASMFYLEFNQRQGFFKNNVDARKAIALAINKPSLTQNILADGSQAPKGLVPTRLAKKGSTDFADDAYVKSGTTYNLRQARRLWKKSAATIWSIQHHAEFTGR